jgi:hypothetical protein
MPKKWKWHTGEFNTSAATLQYWTAKKEQTYKPVQVPPASQVLINNYTHVGTQAMYNV